MKKYHLTLIAIAMIAATMHPVAAQTQYSGDTEQPTTLRMRVESIQSRHSVAVSELVAAFESLTRNPDMISSKEMIEVIDKGDRAIKSTKTSCSNILVSLKTKAKSIEADKSFSEDQKKELLAATESLIIKSNDIAARSAITIKQLEGAYKAMPKWRTIYKTYLDLDGEGKALVQLKLSIDEYIKGLTAEPDAFEAATINEDGKEGIINADEKTDEKVGENKPE